MDAIYASGACGCVSRNYPDRKWRIVCDPRDEQPTFRSRDQAAAAEVQLAIESHAKAALNAESAGAEISP